MAFTKLKPTGIDLSQTFAFTGTVTGDNSGTHVLLDDTYISSSTANITYSSSLITDTYEQYIITGSGIRMNTNDNSIQYRKENDTQAFSLSEQKLYNTTARQVVYTKI